ncbi:hypothetical protein JTE90_012577 [Oedothorax gibbosus]|uniref:Uncharacterized protein n=1 Tax=Oedothorax gibbosus TaxID=931172 RepID=A0AAV6TCN5_9ARAC|nr:hypothetical protein JTE90_012577 [Oedothorax gibbosus]
MRRALDKGQDPNQREMMTTSYYNSAFMADNCNRQSPGTKEVFKRVTPSFRKGKHTIIPSMWARVWPRTLRALQTCYCLCLVCG